VIRILLSLFIGNFFSNALAQSNLQSGLVACYSFTGNANDGTGHNYNGTVQGAVPATDRFGNANSAYQFDGSTRITIPSAPIIANKLLTFSLWAKSISNPGPAEAVAILSVGEPNDAPHFGITLTDHYASLDLVGWTTGGSIVGSQIAITTNSLPLTNNWYHLVLVLSNTSMTMYVNSVNIGSVSTGGNPPFYYSRSGSVAFVGLRSNGAQGFNGVIDDLAIYDRPITAEEVQKLYVDGLICTPSVPPPVGNSTHRCGPGSATLTASGGTLYRWFDMEIGGNLLYEGNPYVTPELPSSNQYYLANVINNIESARVQVSVTIYPQPEITCHFPESALPGISELFSTSVGSGSPPFTYVFDFGDGIKVSTPESSLMHTFKEKGEFGPAVMISDVHGCQAGCSSEIKIGGELFIPNVITANDDTVNRTFTVYIKNNTGNVFLYNGSKRFLMQIFNRWGEEVFSTVNPIQGWAGTGASAGIYFYTINLDEDRFKGWLSVIR